METVQHRISIPRYSLGEEVFNSISHGIGALLGIVGLVLMVVKAQTPLAVTCACLFGASIIITYTISCVYHALSARTAGKRVLRVLDHCGVYLLVFGSYIPASLLGVGGALGWVLFGVVAFVTVVGITFTAINLSKFSKVGVACHLVSGWSILVGVPQIIANCGFNAFLLILAGGIAYTLGAILYGLGRDYRNIHSVFHVFCLAGTFMQFWAIYLYML